MGNGTTLLEALLKSKREYADDPLVASGVTMAQSMPALYNPYGSTGKNLAVTAGTGLLAALLGNIGRSQTDAENLDLYKGALQLQSANPEQRAVLINNNPRLVDFGNALAADERETLIDQQVKSAEEQRKLMNDMQLEAVKAYGRKNPTKLFEAFGLTQTDPETIKNETPVERLDRIQTIQTPEAQTSTMPSVSRPENISEIDQDNLDIFDYKKQVENNYINERKEKAVELEKAKELAKRERTLIPVLNLLNDSYDTASEIGSANFFNPLSTDRAKFSASVSSIMPSLQAMWKGPMSDSDMKRLQGLLPDWNDTAEQIQVKKQEMLQIVSANSGMDFQSLNRGIGVSPQIDTPITNNALTLDDINSLTPEQARQLLERLSE